MNRVISVVPGISQLKNQPIKSIGTQFQFNLTCYSITSRWYLFFLLDLWLIKASRLFLFLLRVTYPTGGLVLGGGGFFIPMRKYSPVSFLFHPTR